ncbi:MAG TPA: EAL domain-containing protein [Pyrinomonadaceae bacterium]|jgi:diguanylate cyclase (GGDEF)-like protein
MSATPTAAGRQKQFDLYRRAVVLLGAAALACAASAIPAGAIDLRFLLLATLTVAASTRLSVQIPRFDTNLTVSDTFIFLALLLYGGGPAVLLAAAEGVCSGLRVSKSKRPITILFNAGVMACSTFATASVLRLLFGEVSSLERGPAAALAAAVGAMALVQYATNTGLVAVGLGIKTRSPLWQTWSKNYLWSSITYLAGGTAAGLVVVFDGTAGIYALAVAVPVIFVVYLTYSRYLEDIKATAAQAERAERERAEQAERHVTELERANRALEESREHFRHAAYHDALTGLPNRLLLADHLRLAIERAKRRPGHSFALIFLDLDRFKYINDSLGHAAGDQLLVTIARRLEGHLRPTDTVARLGGDEFAILLDGLEDEGDAVRVAKRVQQELTSPFSLGGHEVFTTASIGIALSKTGYEHPEGVLRDADTAMYRAKENGKARYELFDAVMHARAVERLRLENDLRRAAERGEFMVYYQPIVSLDADRVAGFEALVRWEHPERGFVPPTEFIPVAEETGMIVEIGQWVLRESCRQMREWQRRSFDNRLLTISVNLSSKQFLQPNLIGCVKQTLHETDLDPRCLKLEITESIMMENAETASAMLVQLRSLGVQLSIDDFGTGYSSLSYLHRFPVNTLKIDRSFVARMGDAGENSEIVHTILTLASNLGMDVIAEGVETKGQLAQLKAMGCPYGQGYLFSRPVDAAGAGALVGTGEAPPASQPGAAERQAPEQFDSALVM